MSWWCKSEILVLYERMAQLQSRDVRVRRTRGKFARFGLAGKVSFPSRVLYEILSEIFPNRTSQPPVWLNLTTIPYSRSAGVL